MKLHQPLENDITIRILTIQPGELNEPLILSLDDHHLDSKNSENSDYQALSYVWGNASNTVEATVNSQPVQITTNLHAALRSMRHGQQPRRVWADALCINQIDTEEKTQQVILMRRIFSEASKVHIWMGSEDEVNAQGLINVMGQVFDFITQIGNRATETDDPQNRESIRHAFLANEDFNSNWKKALSFLTNEWFRRVWTMQEAYLSRTADVVCGKVVFPLDAFIHLFNYLESLGIPKYFEEHSPARVFIATYGWNRHSGSSNSQLGLSTLLKSMQHGHLATDPRDRIFAVLAMVSNQGDGYRPDYSQTMEEVYTRFAVLMMNDEKNLSPLSDTVTSGRSPDLPSWVPDWRGAPTSATLAERVRHFPPRYKASEGVHIERDAQLVELTSGKKLHVKGTRIDTVAHVFGLGDFDISVTANPSWKNVFYHYRDLYVIHKSIAPTPSGKLWPPTYGSTDETHFSAFMRTIAADTLPNSTRRDADDRKTLYLSHFELSGKSWNDILGPWITDDCEREAINSLSGGPLTDIYGLLFNKPTSGLEFVNFMGLVGLRIYNTLQNLAQEVIRSINRVVRKRKLIITEQGYLAVGSAETRVGDTIAGFVGGDVLYVIRKAEQAIAVAEDQNTSGLSDWKLIGETYVHGLMDGEVWENSKSVERIVLA